MSVREPDRSVESIYRYASVSQLAGLLRSGEVSPWQLHDCALDLLQRYGAPLNAIANLLPERGFRDAASAQRQLADAASPLCGIPYAAKDLFAATGGPTTWGGPAFVDQRFDTDAVVVDRLRTSGAVLSAKTSMVEFAGGGRPDVAGASVHGSGRNPWDPQRYAGGSSMGSAIVVAAGLVPYALGTETGGSVVGPAAFCGVTGIRPTYGLVPRTGVMMLSDTLDKVGVLARTADDIREVLGVIADVDGANQGGNDLPCQTIFDREEFERIRVGVATADSADWEPQAAKQLATAMEEFRDLGVTSVTVQLPRTDATGQALQTIIACEAGAHFRQHLERPDFIATDAGQLSRLRAGLARPAVDYIEALQVQRRTAVAIAETFTQVDVLLCCSRPSPAPRLDEPRREIVGGSLADWVRGMANLVGLPGISFPCGLSTDGLPLGLHLVGPHHSEPLLLALVAAFQQATDHHLLRPPV